MTTLQLLRYFLGLSVQELIYCPNGRDDDAFQVSKAQQDVMRAMKMTGLKCEAEAVVGIYSVDILVPELAVAVEVNGPYHYTRTKPKRPLGPTTMKRRHLERAGLHVLHVDALELDSSLLLQQRLNELRDCLMQTARNKLNAGS